ncbi:Alpha/Beta hydrolase protein [Daedaleopsis nitida]|nr:Alpha/Beta hydrolase protein [Daedaleopsis nitida]
MAVLKGNPAYSQPPPPCPEGTSLGDHLRGIADGLAIAPYRDWYAELLPPDSKYTVEDHIVPVDDGEITVRSIIPTGGDEETTYPVMVWCHAGGWVVGGLSMDDNHLRTICVDLEIVIVNVDYRLAPEHVFPTAHEDAYIALKWVVDNTSKLRISLDKGFLVGGDSVGANLVAAMALQAREDPFFSNHPLTGQYLREPLVLHPDAVPVEYRSRMRSYEQNGNAPIINKKLLELYFTMYSANPEDPRLSPALAASHAGLPPAFIQVMECDPLRDDGILYEKLLRKAGTPTKLVLYPGLTHGSHIWFPMISKSIKIDRDERDGLRWLLSLRKPPEA